MVSIIPYRRIFVRGGCPMQQTVAYVLRAIAIPSRFRRHPGLMLWGGQGFRNSKSGPQAACAENMRFCAFFAGFRKFSQVPAPCVSHSERDAILAESENPMQRLTGGVVSAKINKERASLPMMARF